MHKVLLSFTSCHDQDGGKAHLATLDQARQSLRDTDSEAAELVPVDAESFDYYEFGPDAGYQVSWGDSVRFDWHEHLKDDEKRVELFVNGKRVYLKVDDDAE